MPIYEYECQACGLEFEKLVLPNFPPVACPKCHGKQIKKQLSVFTGRSGGKAVGPSKEGAACSSCSSKSCSTCG